ncbi:MAG: cytochrome P460 family protein [Cyanobacteria bacterium J06631_12]
MTRFRWVAFLILFVVSVVGAISLTHITSHRTFQSASYRHSSPYANSVYSESAAGSDLSQRVELPANYAEQFVQYVTVDCTNSRIVCKMYVNPIALEALQTSDIVPSETVLVMETHSASQSENGQLTPSRINSTFVLLTSSVSHID